MIAKSCLGHATQELLERLTRSAAVARFIEMTCGEDVRFFCDAMLGGLSRWLRAMGYEAAFDHSIDDGELVRRAAREGFVVLSSDAPLFERKLVTSGQARALFVPRHAPVEEQLLFVMRRFALAVRDPRCMGCGGALIEASRDAVRDEAPPRAFHSCDRFWRCDGCSHLFWRGTHWAHIAETRETVARAVAAV